MDKIIYDFDDKEVFGNLSLGDPKRMQGGAYFSKIFLQDEESFIFQTPKCITKNGCLGDVLKK